jgi:chaperonin GroES
MSRVANNPVNLPKGVEVNINGSSVSVKGGKGTMEMTLTDGIGIDVNEQSARYEEQTTTSYIFGGYGMKFRPLHDRVLVQREESEEKTAGGIIIPDTAKEKPMQGKVISVGSGARDEQGKVTPLDVKEGDIILFGKWSGTEIKLDGTDYLIMKESDIMGIIG